MEWEWMLWVVLLGGLFYQVRSQEQKHRIAVLAQQLRPYQIESLMERLIQAYQRILAEPDLQRRQALWAHHLGSEQALADQVKRLADGFGGLPVAQTLVSRVVWPYAVRWWPSQAFDFRQVLKAHALGLNEAVRLVGSPQDRAYTILAEMLLLQHSCHWFCRSRATASARLWTRHHTQPQQALDAVTPVTRAAYLRVTQGD